MVTLQLVTYDDATAAIQAVRSEVFQVEQGVDAALEFDGLDEEATHILAYDGETPVGTARIRTINERLAKIERVAVLAAYRGQGIGNQIMQVAIDAIFDHAIPEIKINAQTHAKAFYDKLGFEQYGSEFDEAGIPHVEMRLKQRVAV